MISIIPCYVRIRLQVSYFLLHSNNGHPSASLSFQYPVMSTFFTLTTSTFVLASFHVGAENLNYYKTIDADAIYKFEAGGLNSIVIERPSTITITAPSRGTTHTAFNLLVIAFNPGNAITTDLNGIGSHCLIRHTSLIMSVHEQ